MAEYVYGTDGHEGHWLTGEEIVRCRDCRHGVMDGTRCSWWASYQPILGGREHQLKSADVDPYGFCAWGKRRGE
jgi:hypothetical protein